MYQTYKLRKRFRSPCVGLLPTQDELYRDGILITPALPQVSKVKILQISSSKVLKNKYVPCESTAEEVVFEWSHREISSTDSKSRTTSQDSGSEWVNSLFKGWYHE